MADEEINVDIDDLTRRMDGALASLSGDFGSLRTGRASASMVEPIMVHQENMKELWAPKKKILHWKA